MLETKHLFLKVFPFADGTSFDKVSLLAFEGKTKNVSGKKLDKAKEILYGLNQVHELTLANDQIN